MGTYTVQKGDTLSAIARRFNTTTAEIAKENNIKNVNIIHVGQVLKVPETTAEDVKKAFNNCLSAIENLPEYKVLSAMLNG